MQRNFEDRLGQRIEKLDESQKSRSETLSAALQNMQTDMHALASRLVDVAVSMQRLEVKMDIITESGAHVRSQQRPQKHDSILPENSNYGVTSSMRSQISETSDAGWDSRIRRTQSKAEQDKAQDDVVVWKRSSPDSLAANRPDNEIAGNKEVAARKDRLGEGCAMPAATDMLFEVDKKFETIEKKLEKISASLGIKSGANDGDDEEDRRRLKEKLKAAIEVDRRSRILTIVSRSEVWLEYIFGICSPDQRLGKRGSR